MRFAAGEQHAAFGSGELFDDLATGVEPDDGAVGERELARAGGWCGGKSGREGGSEKRGRARETEGDEREYSGGGRIKRGVVCGDAVERGGYSVAQTGADLSACGSSGRSKLRS